MKLILRHSSLSGLACHPNCWIVWVGGVDDHYDSWLEAKSAADEWAEKGYGDIHIEKRQI